MCGIFHGVRQVDYVNSLDGVLKYVATTVQLAVFCSPFQHPHMQERF
jgi:hypothetical protein